MTSTLDEIIQRTIELVAIPAPTFQEHGRAEVVREWWRLDGVTQVNVDDQGNLVGCLRPGVGSDEPVILVCAHLDTVFRQEIRHETTWNGSILIGPSVADDSVAVVSLSLLGRCISDEVRHPVWIAATTGEEGLGNLAGVNYLLDTFSMPIGTVIALEGDYLGRVNVKGVGSVRGRVELVGAGGHSWEEPEKVSAVEAATWCVQRILEDARTITSNPRVKSTLNVGRFSGGESVNSRAISCSFDVEARSEDPDHLQQLEQLIQARIGELDSTLEVTWVDLGRRPAGSISIDHPLVRVAASVLQEKGIEPIYSAASTDANAGYARSVPSITLGVVFGGNTHTEQEWIDTSSLEIGFGVLCETIEHLATNGW